MNLLMVIGHVCSLTSTTGIIYLMSVQHEFIGFLMCIGHLVNTFTDLYLVKEYKGKIGKATLLGVDFL